MARAIKAAPWRIASSGVSSPPHQPRLVALDMAFTDLAEHLEEVFGEVRVEHLDGFGLLDRKPDKERRTPEGHTHNAQAKARRRHAAAVACHAEALESGERPSRCLGPECCNLLTIHPMKGGGPRYCTNACRCRAHRHAASAGRSSFTTTRRRSGQ